MPLFADEMALQISENCSRRQVFGIRHAKLIANSDMGLNSQRANQNNLALALETILITNALARNQSSWISPGVFPTSPETAKACNLPVELQ